MSEGNPKTIPEVTEMICMERMKHVTDDIKSLQQRMDRLETRNDDMHKMALNIERISTTMQQVLEELHEHEKRLDVIEKEDSDKWKYMIRYIATAIVGAVVGFVLKSIGLF